MPTRHLLYQKDYPINDYIRVMIPTVGEVLENEDNYYSMVSMQYCSESHTGTVFCSM